ncbi:6812_t:CDS:1, partial [Racocetra persica]
CSMIDPNWEVTNNSNSIFCLLKLRKTVVKLVENHSTHQMLLLKLDGTFTTNSNEIWKECVSEMMQICKNNDLLQL